MWEPLTESEARARMALEACGAGVWSWDAARNAITADARYRELYGFGADEVITPANWQQRIHPDDRAQLVQRVSECLSGGEQWREEFRIAHPAHGVRWLEGYGRVRRDEAGRVLGLIGINLDVTERDRTSAALRHSEARLKTLIDGAAEGIIAIDERGTVESFNRAATRIFGFSDAEVVGHNVSMLMPEPDRSGHDGYIARYLETGEAKIIGIGRDVMGRRRDGSLFPLHLGISEVEQDGQRLFIGVVRDITERKQAEESQRRLINELNHRVKNTLATVQAMAEQTLRHSSDPAHFIESFRGRVQALARAHNLLAHATWGGVELGRLVREQLAIAAGADAQVACAGPDVELTPQAVVHLSLALHELGTNARKHGALSVPEGRLSVTWDVRHEGEGPVLVLNWEERGGRPAAAPVSAGFGLQLVSRGIKHTLRGEVRHSFAPEGVTCEIRMPLG
jgi:PAS domain S-box-containing protein